MEMESSSNVFPLDDHLTLKYSKPSEPDNLPEIIRQKSAELGYTNNKDIPTERGGESFMESKEYIDLKINGLEENINQRFQSQEKLFSEKLNTLSTKVDGQHALLVSKIDALSEGLKKDVEIIVQNKIDGLQTKLDNQKKENRNFTWMIVGVAVAAASFLTAIIQFII